MGWATLNLARPEDAAGWFQRALESGIESEEPLAGLIEASYVRGEPADAVEHAERLVKTYGPVGWTWAKLIEAHLRTGDEAAVAKLTEDAMKALSEEPQRRVFFRGLAKAYLAMGKYVDAEKWALEALALTKDRDARLDEILAWSLMNQDRPEEAAKVLASGLSAHPGSAELLLTSAFNDLVADNAEAAERKAKDLLERGPALANAHVALAYALGQQGRFDEAAKHAERALAMSPDRANRTLMAWVLIAGNIDIDRGLELAVKAVDTPESYNETARELACLALAEHCLGVAYLKQGRYGEAIEQLSEASRIRPSSSIIREHLEQANTQSLR
jgi:tetratricopeptide (TPR) repeat protein